MAFAMLITREQLRAFRTVQRIGFTTEMMAKMRQFSPSRTAHLSDHTMRRWVEQGIEQAGEHGFRRRGPVRCYLEAMLLLGVELMSDPQHSWIRPPDDLSEMLRAVELCHALNRYVQLALRPEQGRLARRSARRASTLPGGEALESRALALLRSLAPERCEFAGGARIAMFVRTALARAAGLGVRDPDGQLVVLLAMFRGGIGCLEDPQYPWARRAFERFLAGRAAADAPDPAIRMIEARYART